jgi:hypothetical protein
MDKRKKPKPDRKQPISDATSKELSDDDLEKVAGGFSNSTAAESTGTVVLFRRQSS